MITGKQRSELKKIAHKMEPKVLIGKNGLSDNLIKQIDQILTKEEIVKVKILNNNMDEKEDIINEIIEELNGEFVSSLGNKFVLYRKNEDKSIINF